MFLGNSITLTDGRQFNQSDINFDDQSYTWTLKDSGEDVTLVVPIAGKRMWPNFDANKYALLVSDRTWADRHNGAAAPVVGSDSIWGNFAEQIYTDPLGAPIDAANTIVKNTVKSAIGNPFASLTFIAIAALAIWFFLPRIVRSR